MGDAVKTEANLLAKDAGFVEADLGQLPLGKVAADQQQFPMWEFTEKWVIVKSNSTGKGLTDGPKKFVIGRQFV